MWRKIERKRGVVKNRDVVKSGPKREVWWKIEEIEK